MEKRRTDVIEVDMWTRMSADVYHLLLLYDICLCWSSRL